MTQLESFDKKYYDYSQEENDRGYCNKHDDQCNWCDGNQENHEDWRYEEYCDEDLENLTNYQHVENRKNVYWEDRECPENPIHPQCTKSQTSTEVLCPHCNYYVNAAVDPGPKWYMSLLGNVLLPCCLCCIPHLTVIGKKPIHSCPLCLVIIPLEKLTDREREKSSKDFRKCCRSMTLTRVNQSFDKVNLKSKTPMDTNEPNPSDKNSTSTLDCNQSCNTSETLNPETTGSKSKPSTNDEFEIVQEIVKSSEEMTKQHKSPLPKIFKHIMRGTQTPLTLIGVSMPKYNEEERKSDPPIQETKDSGKTEISVALNSSAEIVEQSSSSGAKESLQGPSTSVRSSFSQFRVEAVTVKFSHEAATQATPPHPSLTSTKSSPHPRDVLQIATSVSSNRSGPKSEVLTVTTDYSSRTPDARSLLLDVIDEDHPRRYINVEPSTPAIAITNSSPILRLPGLPELSMAPPYINDQRSFLNSERNRGEHRWNWRNCLKRNTPQGEEPDVQPYGIGPPPTYSGIFREPRSIYTESRIPLPSSLSNDTTASFVTPIPPPSYAQAQGLSSRGIWTARPTATICPRCATVVVTAVETRRSAITHVSALALFLCGCWPCCLIPYCVDSCKSTHHYCPVCRNYLGTYTPW